MLKTRRSAGVLTLACALAAAQGATTETVLHNFVTPPRGSFPTTALTGGASGELYGTAGSGGALGAGVVFRLDASGETVLYNFAGGADGKNPNSGLVRDPAGNFYGTTDSGGAANVGVVFKMDPAGSETVLYSFTGGADGRQPVAGLILDAAGSLYGTTYAGGAKNAGVVFKLDATGHETVLYNFTGGADGSGPYGGVVLDPAGNLYGTTAGGGAASMGCVYKLDPAGRETVLHSFKGTPDGATPLGGLLRDPAGRLYGTTVNGGALNAGAVYMLGPERLETVLYSFTGGADGKRPQGGVIRDSAGNLYGSTTEGGAASSGVVYMLDATGRETVLHSFAGGADGSGPGAGLIRDPLGNLFGTTIIGGTANVGTVYKVDATSQETVLYSFPSGTDGYEPAGVIGDSAGTLYGATYFGGPADAGVVFEVDATGHETVLYSFTGGADGGEPYAGVIRDPAGNLYGTTYAGGTASAGVVYMLDTSGSETVLHTFSGGADGGQPTAGVVRDPAGNLYGTTYAGGAANKGVVYNLNYAHNERPARWCRSADVACG